MPPSSEGEAAVTDPPTQEQAIGETVTDAAPGEEPAADERRIDRFRRRRLLAVSPSNRNSS